MTKHEPCNDCGNVVGTPQTCVCREAASKVADNFYAPYKPWQEPCKACGCAWASVVIVCPVCGTEA